MLHPPQENELLEAAITGDSSALEQLLWKYYEPLERHLLPKIPAKARKHFAAEDILQTVFTNVFRDIRRFRPEHDGVFFAWLKTIADHRLIDALRKLDRGGVQQVSLGNAQTDSSIQNLIAEVCDEAESPSKHVASKEAIQAMHVALAGLPEDQQTAVRLNCLEHKSISEVAQITGRTEAAVRGLVHRGKKNLALAMGRSSKWLSSR